MLTSKDFQICVDGLKELEETKERSIVIRKLELVIKAEQIKNDSENEMMKINDELRKIFDEEKGE